MNTTLFDSTPPTTIRTNTTPERWPRPPRSTVSPFKGPGITADDERRLSTFLQRVVDLMSDGNWRTLRTISDTVGCPEAGASARLRDLRRPEHGGHEVQRRRVAGGLYEYRVLGLPGANPGAEGDGLR